MAGGYQDLQVWQLSMELAQLCYAKTRCFPKEEVFGLTSQIRRAAASVPANIAEGNGRRHRKEYLNHLSIARGSLKELETHLILSHRVGFLAAADLDELLQLSERISQMLTNLKRSLQRNLD